MKMIFGLDSNLSVLDEEFQEQKRVMETRIKKDINESKRDIARQVSQLE